MKTNYLEGLLGGLGVENGISLTLLCFNKNSNKRRYQMLQSISWSTYFSCCIFLLILYYIVVAVIYYRQDLLSKFNHRSNFQQRLKITPGKKFDEKNYQSKLAAEPEVPIGDDLAAATDLLELEQAAKDELQAFTIAAAAQYNKTALLTALKKILKRYAALKNSPYQKSISKLLVQECKNDCAADLSEEEAEGLWND